MKKNYFTSGLPKIITKIVYLLLVMFSLVSISSYSQITKTFTSSGTLEVPAGVTTLSVQTWGAGGGGGGSNELLTLVSLGAAGGGGGGGAYSAATVPVTPVPANAQFNYTVGEGGAGGSLENINGLDGGTSTFSTISAGGGKGGGGGVLLSGAGAGQGSIVGNFKGGNGGSTYLVLIDLSNIFDIKLGINRSGGGGGSAGPGSVGVNASSLTGGPAVVDGGAGGNGGEKKLLASLVSTSNVKGLPGSLPGGGGGGVGKGLVNGVLDFTENNSNGGKGGNGQIKVTYTCSTYNISSLTADANCAQTSTITLHSTPERLPIGTYTVTYNRSFPLATGLTATMVVSRKGMGTIDVVGLPIEGLSMITITKLESVDCSSTVNASITFNRPVKPAVDTVTHPSCAEPKGKVVLSGLVIGGMIHQTGISTRSYQITAAVQTITGLDSGTYNFVVSNGVCSSQTVSAIASVIINNPPPFRTWNGSWDVIPTIENKVIFASNYDKDESVEACSCEVKSGSHVTFKTGKYLKIRNELIVDPAGSLTFENNASLVQMTDDPVIVAKNSGTIAYKRYTKPVKRYDYTYWSSPVAGQTLYDLSPNTLGDKYHGFDPNINNWVTYHNGAPTMFMTAGEGYIIRAPQTFSITSAAIDCNPKFIGKPNNGEVTKELEPGKLYLLGNPYPSAISADAFLTKNNGKLEGTLYFWTHNSPPSDNVDPFGNETTKYNYTTNDYASYNKTGGVITAKPAVTDEDSNDLNDNNNLSTPTGKIAAGQGFFASAKDVGTIVFDNSMRLLSDAVMDNSQFFKFETTAKSTGVTEKSRLWLNLTNEEGAFKQTLIGYITGATNDYDNGFDGESFDGNEFIDFYSVNQGANLSIQGRALPFVKKDSVVLGYRTTIKGEFQISIDHADGALASQKVFLEDKVMQVLHDLKKSYSFTTEKGVFNDRFVLRYEDKNAEIIDTVAVSAEGVVVATSDKNIMITTTDALIKEVYIYNFSGGLVYSDTKINATATTISNLLEFYLNEKSIRFLSLMDLFMF